MRRWTTGLLALLAVLSIGTPAFAQGGGASSTGTIQGRVWNDTTPNSLDVDGEAGVDQLRFSRAPHVLPELRPCFDVGRHTEPLYAVS